MVVGRIGRIGRIFPPLVLSRAREGRTDIYVSDLSETSESQAQQGRKRGRTVFTSVRHLSETPYICPPILIMARRK